VGVHGRCGREDPRLRCGRRSRGQEP
jgi:hypothetical protein